MTGSSSSPSSRTDPRAAGNHNYTLAASRRGVLPADMELATTVVAVVPDNTALEDAPLDVGLVPVVSTPVLLALRAADPVPVDNTPVLLALRVVDPVRADSKHSSIRETQERRASLIFSSDFELYRHIVDRTRYASSGSSSCSTCSAGRFASSGSSSCSICSAGRAASSGSSSCTRCRSGRYTTPID